MEFDIDILKKEYLVSNKTIKEISNKFNISENRILLLFKKNNIRKRKPHTKEVKERIRDKLKEKGIQPKQRYSGAVWNRGKKGSQVPWNKGKKGLQISNKKGKTYEEMYGEERAKEYKKIIKESRKNQIFPFKDSSPERIIQEFLKELNIIFSTHKYIEIEQGYQCDILIPEQEGIKQKTVIECDGDYWHFNPIKYNENDFRYVRGKKLTANERWELDEARNKELIEKGFKVIRIWESKIKSMSIQDLKDIIAL
jgi:very-short-patch-repair endonuclease